MGRSPPGVAMGVSGEAQVHGEEQSPSLPQAQHPESAPLSGKPMGPPGGKQGPDESLLLRQVPGAHGSMEL